MDPRSFDHLARSLAAPQTRRSLLGTLAAVGAGLLGACGIATAQVSQAQCGNGVCGSNPGVCKPGCVCCVYPNGNQLPLHAAGELLRHRRHDHNHPGPDHDDDHDSGANDHDDNHYRGTARLRVQRD